MGGTCRSRVRRAASGSGSLAAAGLVLALVAAGCSGDDPPTVAAETGARTGPSSPVPVPEGVDLTEPGSTLRVGEPAVAPYVVGPDRRAVVRVTVSRIRRGAQQDFVGYQLDERTSQSTPWYVDVAVSALGRSSLGRAAIPVYGLDSTDTYFPAAQLQGSFSRCAPPDPVKELTRGEGVRGCLVFFVPQRARLEAVQLRSLEGTEEISWSVPPQPVARPLR